MIFNTASCVAIDGGLHHIEPLQFHLQNCLALLDRKHVLHCANDIRLRCAGMTVQRLADFPEWMALQTIIERRSTTLLQFNCIR